MTRLRYVLLISGVVLVAAAMAGVAQPHQGRSATPAADDHHRHHHRHGGLHTRPGQLRVRRDHERRPGRSDRGNSAQAQAIIDALKKAGVAAADIQTSLSRSGRRPRATATGSPAPGIERVTVTTSLDKAGALVDDATGAGANNVDGPNLSTATSTYYNQALKLASATRSRRHRRSRTRPD